MTAAERRSARFAVAVLVLVLLMFASGTDRRVDALEDQISRQQDQVDMLSRQVAQLNGRVFLGTDIPDTESGRQ